MENDEFLRKLNEYIKAVFDHEHDFIFELLREFSGWEVNSFYMASERCEVTLIDMESGQSCLTTINTDKFINWAEGLKSD